jgi:UDP-N-acetylmuramoyl-tripeptide--D-alanyl-D-alanine ligase
VTTVGALIGLGGLVLGTVARLHVLLHLHQIEHYEAARLLVWLRRRGERLQARWIAITLGAAAALAAIVALDVPLLAVAAGVALVGAFVALTLPVFRRHQAKPLVFTPRARRLMALSVALAAFIPFATYALVASFASGAAAVLAAGVAVAATHVLAPEILIAADWALRPVQRMDNERFVRRAQRRLREVDPVVVGITGSYGKTTTKVCASRVADLRGPAYATPASFNSRLGVVRAINEGLEPRHRTFIAEMGAYRPGDISELCGLVRPSIGILTAIGPVHLERFGSLDAIEQTKGELGASLPADGVLITRADDDRCRRAALRTPGRVVLFAPAPHPDAGVFADDVALEGGRTRFALNVAATGERAVVRSHLLGLHNVANLTAAAALGLELELPLGAIARALSSVQPLPHRLAPIVNATAGIVVIDDAYNSNPEGAAAALDVLAAHAAQRRILVTPGMVELGEREYEENCRFGRRAASVCDEVVLIGRRQTAAIQEGLGTSSFPPEQVHVVPDARGAAAWLASRARKGDVILFENDLPDLYSRADEA